MNLAHPSGKSSGRQASRFLPAAGSVWRRRLGVVLGLVVLALGIGYVARRFLWSVVHEMMVNVVPIVFTPFILEATTFLVGLTAVLIWNNYHRKQDEKDEWVYLSQVHPESEKEKIPEPLRRRAGESLFRESEHPEPGAGAAVLLDRVEGYIDLGLCDEAARELLDLSETFGDTHPEILRLRFLLCMKSKGSEAACGLVDEWIARGLIAAESVAAWLPVKGRDA